MRKKKVLFVCVQNSARSQMAEAWLNHLYGDTFEGHSAGLEPGELNPLAVQVMREEGIDISGNETKSVFDKFKAGEIYHAVITVCDESNAERCPIFPGIVSRLHWGFEDPARVTGTAEEKLVKAQRIRDEIRETLTRWVESGGAGSA
ncbi:MAG: arsenate reductase ArsC [Acidobacteria bacterium]|nr:arsenate reductase ArsC [Acidobacteriota bacterium]